MLNIASIGAAHRRSLTTMTLAAHSRGRGADSGMQITIIYILCMHIIFYTLTYDEISVFKLNLIH